MTNVGDVADWDGRGLPPVAAERVRRAAAGGAWTSLLSAPAAAGLEVAGFDPVGEVMGSDSHKPSPLAHPHHRRPKARCAKHRKF